MLRSRVLAARQKRTAEAACRADAASDDDLREERRGCKRALDSNDLNDSDDDDDGSDDDGRELRQAAVRSLVDKLSRSTSDPADPLPPTSSLMPPLPFPSVSWWCKPMHDAVALAWEARMQTFQQEAHHP